MLEGHVELVARAGADGAHLAGIEALAEALPGLKPDRIAGVGGLTTRHDSMAAGEAGADYVLFGEPDAGGARPSTEAIAERLQWWAELFEPPCVGFAASRQEAFEFATAGADFVLVGDIIWTDSRGAAAALIDVEAAIRQAPRGIFRNRQGRTGIAPDMKILRSDLDARKRPGAFGKRGRGADLADASGSTAAAFGNQTGRKAEGQAARGDRQAGGQGRGAESCGHCACAGRDGDACAAA